MINISRIIFSVYFFVWISIIYQNIDFLSSRELFQESLNALVISLFVGLGLNVNAFLIRNRDNTYLTLMDRLIYVKENFFNAFAFFFIPFCVSSASSIVMAAENNNMVTGIFGTENYFLVIAAGFLTFIFVPGVYIYFKHGWDRTGVDD